MAIDRKPTTYRRWPDYGPRNGMNGPRRCRWRDAVADAGACPSCGAPKGVDCYKSTGGHTRLPHVARRRLLARDWTGA